MAHFVGNGTKVKIPSEIKAPLAAVAAFEISDEDEDAAFPAAAVGVAVAISSDCSAVGALGTYINDVLHF